MTLHTRAADMLAECAREFAGLPRSLGYDFTHTQKIDALIADLREAAALDELVRENERLGLYDDQAQPAYETVQPEIVNRYTVEKRSGGGFWPYCVRASGGTMELFVGHKNKCEEVAAALRTACLDGAFMASKYAAPAPAQPRQPLSDAALEALWGKTFSTRNPFCPCDLRTFIKTARAVERAITGDKS